MTPPKHLWSGDWRADSQAAADELANRKRAPRPPAEPPPEPPAPKPARVQLPQTEPPGAEPPRARRPPRPPRSRRKPSVSPRTRATLVVAGFVLAAAAIGYGLNAAFGTSTSRVATGPKAYLGLQIGSRALMGGLLIDSVDPGSPAQRAGVRGGDVLSQIGQVEVHSPADVRALMQGRRPGDQVELGIERGSYSYTVDVTLASRP